MKKDRSDRSFGFHAMAIQIKGSLFATNLLAFLRNFMTHETEREKTLTLPACGNPRGSQNGGPERGRDVARRERKRKCVSPIYILNVVW